MICNTCKVNYDLKETTMNEKDCQGRCPECGTDNIDYADSRNTDGNIVYEAVCAECNTQFDEVYSVQYYVTAWKESQ